MSTVIHVLTRLDFWIYLVMAVIFILGVIFCVLPVRKVQTALNAAQKKLGVRRQDGSYAYSDPGFLKCREINDSWARFLSNLEMMRKNNAACEVTNFINAQTAIHEPGHSAFGEMIPGTLTTLGIVGSFYGIVSGLSMLDLSTSQTMEISIGILITGMRTAFNTSIVGAILALAFQFLRRIAIGSAEKTVKSFVRSCQIEIMSMLTPDATLMQSIHAILAELRRINDKLNV